VYIETPLRGTSNWGLYQVGGNAYFGGNLGIGTTSPTAKLNVFSAGDNVYLSSWTANSKNLSFFEGNNSNAGWHILTTDNNPLGFSTNNSADQLVIATSGKIGMGTSSPNDILTTKGATGILDDNGFSTADLFKEVVFSTFTAASGAITIATVTVAENYTSGIVTVWLNGTANGGQHANALYSRAFNFTGGSASFTTIGTDFTSNNTIAFVDNGNSSFQITSTNNGVARALGIHITVDAGCGDVGSILTPCGVTSIAHP
jgi:hypothetical protein